MKLALSLTLSFLLFAFITKLPLAFSNDAEQVLDINGNPLVSGVEYFIRPPWGPHGGLKLAKTGELECPVTVLYGEASQGLSVIFRRISEGSAGTIFTGIPLYIHFPESAKPNCAESSRWLVYVDNDIDKSCVGTGYTYPHDMEILRGNFDIQKSSFGYTHYKLQFRLLDGTTFDIGSYLNNDHEGGSRLVLAKQEAFDVVFIPAEFPDNINNDGIIKSVA